MNTRAEFHKLLSTYGHYVLIARQNKRVRCGCWNDTTRSANPHCSECLGSGSIYILDKVLCRSDISNIPMTLGRSVENTEPGLVQSVTKLFFVEYSVIAQKNDMILECDWDDDTPKIGVYSELYRVNFPNPIRGHKGEINHVEVHCAREPINADIRIKTMLNKYTAGIIVK